MTIITSVRCRRYAVDPLVNAQKPVDKVRVPNGESSSVAVSSLLTPRNTSAANLAAAPGAASRIVIPTGARADCVRDYGQRFPAPPALRDTGAQVNQRTRHKHQQIGQKQRHFGLVHRTGVVDGDRHQRQRGDNTGQRAGDVITPPAGGTAGAG